MKLLTFFLFTFGEWIEANFVTLAIAFIGWLISAAGALRWAVRFEASALETKNKVDELFDTFENHSDEFRLHTGDRSLHVNVERQQMFEKRFDKLENTVETGHAKIEAKIDKLTEIVYKQQ